MAQKQFSLFSFITFGGLLALYSSNSFSAPIPLPDNYPSLKAEIKQGLLAQRIQQDPYDLDKLPDSGLQFGWSLRMLWNLTTTDFLITTFTNVSDEMPKKRLRYIHTYGSAGMVSFVANPESGFTGIFEKGAPGIVRFSLAALRENKEKDPFVPGMALKFLIDGKPSENVVAIYSLDGQGTNANFFANEFNTAIPEPSPGILTTLANAFNKAIQLLDRKIRPENERTLPTDRLAHIRPNGDLVPSEQVQAPYQLIFAPTEAVKTLIRATDTTTDFRVHLARLEEKTVLYTVYGLRQPKDTKRVELGRVVLTSKLVASPYTDQKLFFQHLAHWSN